MQELLRGGVAEAEPETKALDVKDTGPLSDEIRSGIIIIMTLRPTIILIPSAKRGCLIDR